MEEWWQKQQQEETPPVCFTAKVKDVVGYVKLGAHAEKFTAVPGYALIPETVSIGLGDKGRSFCLKNNQLGATDNPEHMVAADKHMLEFVKDNEEMFEFIELCGYPDNIALKDAKPVTSGFGAAAATWTVALDNYLVECKKKYKRTALA
eukprot:TRINITY_DN59900_c0_g1_i2.p1 TRINITY_DN59900_c0_g1~~TRINITY_DN59900_c0_g1_i2.p1  ORF type:complete len:171 (+),score=11.15 TRINITY_DN59900_c0_g1_i2:67-513(+)